MKYQDILKEAPSFWVAYQHGYTLEKRAGALNMAYLAGSCNMKLRSTSVAGVSSDTGYAPIYEDQAVRGIINYGANILIDPWRNMLTAMIQNMPKYEVYPASEDDDKKIVADIATEALKYHDEKIFNLNSKVGELFVWATGPVGTAYLELFPEDTDIPFPVAGTLDDNKAVVGGKPVDEFGRGTKAKLSTRMQKRLQIQVKTIWDIACSEDSPDGLIDGCTLQICRGAIPLSSLREWGKVEAVSKIEKGLAQKTSVIDDPKTQDVRSAKGISSRQRNDILTGEDRQILVYYVFHKPTNEFKNGWYGITDDKGNELYFIPTLPINGVMPYTQLDTNNLDGGEFIKKSVFDDARGLQVLYQGLFDSRASHSMLAAAPPMQRFKHVKTSSDSKRGVYIYPKQGQTEVIEFDGPLLAAVTQNPALANVMKPRPMEMTSLNPDVKDLMEECKQMVLNVTGQNLANVGTFPNSNISGASVQEQVSVDQMGQLPLLALCNDFWHRFRAKTLKAIRAIYPVEQLTYMLNNETISEAKKFKMEDIDDSFDIRIISTDGLPSTPKGKIEFYAQLMQIAPTDDEKMDAWSKIKETVSGYGLINNDTGIEEKLAELENKMLVEDTTLISDMNVMVPSVDSIGNPVFDPMGRPIPEPLAKQRVQRWANRFQNEVMHAKTHRPLVVGPIALRNGAEITQLAAWHLERTEENYAIKNKPVIQENQNGHELPEADMQPKPSQTGMQ